MPQKRLRNIIKFDRSHKIPDSACVVNQKFLDVELADEKISYYNEYMRIGGLNLNRGTSSKHHDQLWETAILWLMLLLLLRKK